MNSSEIPISIPNENKRQNEVQCETMLSKSIQNNDLSYIQQFLVSKTRKEDIEKLSLENKKQLAVLLTELFDQPLRLEAIECIYELMQDTGAVDGISQKLVERSSDFKKLVVLKGKIDYLKYLNRQETKMNPKNEFTQ